MQWRGWSGCFDGEVELRLAALKQQLHWGWCHGMVLWRWNFVLTSCCTLEIRVIPSTNWSNSCRNPTSDPGQSRRHSLQSGKGAQMLHFRRSCCGMRRILATAAFRFDGIKVQLICHFVTMGLTETTPDDSILSLSVLRCRCRAVFGGWMA